MIAIDPGKQGGIAYNAASGAVECIKMPATMADVYDTLKAIRDTHADNCKAMVEDVGYKPGDGGKGAFTFGEGVGHIHMALYALGISVVETPSAQAWQKVCKLPVEPVKGLNGKQLEERKRRRKNLIKDQMQRRYPNIKKVTLAVSDALGIYTYAVNRSDYNKSA
jgi:hypothetical protein